MNSDDNDDDSNGEVSLLTQQPQPPPPPPQQLLYNHNIHRDENRSQRRRFRTIHHRASPWSSSYRYWISLPTILLLLSPSLPPTQPFSTSLITTNNIRLRPIPPFDRRLTSSSLSSTANNLPPPPPTPPPNNNPSPPTTNQYHIPPTTIATIKSQANIINVIESYGLPQFSRSSSTRATAICPFHDDTNPSLSIDGNRGMYKCFSCGAGGDVFHFVREMEDLKKKQDGLTMRTDGDGDGKMSFVAAVRKVANEYCHGVDISLPSSSGGKAVRTPAQKARLEKLEKARGRIRLVNTYAAEYFARNLVMMPEAGVARAHLMKRGVDPGTVRAFGLGYAPDVYYGGVIGGGGSGSGGTKKWGEGSLVELLEGEGFTPQELVESGLVVVTSGGRGRLEGGKRNGKQQERSGKSIREEILQKEDLDDDKEKGGTNEDEEKEEEEEEEEGYQLQFTDLMDRFRGRLMVPIFDSDGRYVLSFGGRHIDLPKSSTSPSSKSKVSTSDSNDDKGVEKPSTSFQPPRYINGPETSLFLKRSTLFALHSARASLSSSSPLSSSTPSSSSNAQPPPISVSSGPKTIVIVEGYFDAIALYGAGVEEVSACMGTGLTLEQLDLAAGVVGSGGRIILCLDADKAGIEAIERICTTSTSSLFSFTESASTSLLVATIPGGDSKGGGGGPKDPAEYLLQSKKGGGNLFRTEVMETAIPWSDWLIERFISRYDGGVGDNHEDKNVEMGEEEVFRDVCDQITTFLSNVPSPIDRTRRAYRAASILADRILTIDYSPSSSDDNEGKKRRKMQSMDSLRIQLESDLLSMASRKAAAKEALERRIESIDGVGGGGRKNKENVMAKMSRGEGVTVLPANNKNYRRTEKEEKRERGSRGAGIRGRDDIRERYPSKKKKTNGATVTQRYSNRNDSASSRKFQGTRWVQKTTSPPPLTEHFEGFKFHQTDAEWLGLSGKGQSKGDFLLGDVETLNDDTTLGSGRRRRYPKKEDAVYFNSNCYLGDDGLPTTSTTITNATPQTLTAAGFTTGDGVTTASSRNDLDNAYELGLGTNTNSLLLPDTDQILLDAEVRLLRCMVQYGSARLAMMSALANHDDGQSIGISGNDEDEDEDDDSGAALLEWSSPEREWLFRCLTGDKGHESLPMELQDGGTVAQLRHYLASRPDVIEGSFTQLPPPPTTTTSPSSGDGDVSNHVVGGEREDYLPIVDDEPPAATIIDNNDGGGLLDTVQNDDDTNNPSKTIITVDRLEYPFTTASTQINTENISPAIPPTQKEGTLEMFFVTKGSYSDNGSDCDNINNDDDDITNLDLEKGSISHEVRAELTVQQTAAVMLRARALRKLSVVKNRWKVAVEDLEERRRQQRRRQQVTEEEGNGNDDHENEHKSDDNDNENDKEIQRLENFTQTLGHKVLSSTSTVRNLTTSCQALTTRLLDFCTGSANRGVEGYMSDSKREELAKDLEAHIAALPPDPERRQGTDNDGDEDLFYYEKESLTDDDYEYGSEQFEGDSGANSGRLWSDRNGGGDGVEDFDLSDIFG